MKRISVIFAILAVFVIMGCSGDNDGSSSGSEGGKNETGGNGNADPTPSINHECRYVGDNGECLPWREYSYTCPDGSTISVLVVWDDGEAEIMSMSKEMQGGADTPQEMTVVDGGVYGSTSRKLAPARDTEQEAPEPPEELSQEGLEQMEYCADYEGAPIEGCVTPKEYCEMDIQNETTTVNSKQ